MSKKITLYVRELVLWEYDFSFEFGLHNRIMFAKLKPGTLLNGWLEYTSFECYKTKTDAGM